MVPDAAPAKPAVASPAAEADRSPPLRTRTYERRKAKLQAELLKLQIGAQGTGQRFVILFEGRDAAGKGGTIERLMEHLNPR